MQNMSDEELAKIINGDSSNICNEVSKDCRKFENCVYCKANWLKSEHKEPIKLSNAERVILENIDKECKWIARDKNSKLYVYKHEPSKGMVLGEWLNNEYSEGIAIFNHLFQFITWNDEQAYNIQELLEG